MLTFRKAFDWDLSLLSCSETFCGRIACWAGPAGPCHLMHCEVWDVLGPGLDGARSIQLLM